MHVNYLVFNPLVKLIFKLKTKIEVIFSSIIKTKRAKYMTRQGNMEITSPRHLKRRYFHLFQFYYPSNSSIEANIFQKKITIC